MITPGRWAIFWISSPAGTSARIFADSTPPVDIAHIPKEWNGDGSNARLIATAPRLLAALERMADLADHVVRSVDMRAAQSEARAAIAAARGET